MAEQHRSNPPNFLSSFSPHSVSRRRCLGHFGVWLAIFGCFHQAQCRSYAADFGADANRASDTFAHNVLVAEQAGDLETRAALVGSIDPKMELDVLSKSLLGLMRDANGNWSSIEESVATRLSADALKNYVEFRKRQPASIEGHLTVAAWCERNRMFDQQRAHLQAILKINPSHEAARQLLQHRFINGRWYSSEEMAEITRREQWTNASIKKYGPEVQRIFQGMSTGGEKQFLAALKRLQRLDSDDAIPAVSLSFAGSTGSKCNAAIEWLGNRQNPEAAIVIADWAISNPDKAVQAACTRALQERSLFEFAPYLLNSAKAGMTAQSIPVYRPDGTLAGVRHVVAEEGREEVQLQVQDNVNQRRTVEIRGADRMIAARGGRSTFDREIERVTTERDERALNALVDMQVRAEETRKALELQAQVNAENERQKLRNMRIAEVLSDTAGTDRYATIDQLWDWWASYTERELPPIKFTSMRYDFRFQNRGYDFVLEQPIREGAGNCECFVAGTIVQTSQGPKAIETLTVGDAVLSKNLFSGELFWDMVVATTVQPPKPTLEIETAEGSFRCTGGHLFWVSGKGWTKSRELLPGDVLHGAVKPVKVKASRNLEPEATYNLVAEKSHNYFVGEGMLLTHDFEEPTLVPVKVPGLLD